MFFATGMRLERYIEDKGVYEMSVCWENQWISTVYIPQQYFITYQHQSEVDIS